MLRSSTTRQRRGLTFLVLTALTGALLALIPSTAANAACRTSARGVCQAPQTLTFPAIADIRVDQGPVALTAYTETQVWTRQAARSPLVYGPGTPVEYTSHTTAVCTISGSTAVLVAPGACTITASAPSDTYIAAATPVDRTFQVLPLPVVSNPELPKAKLALSVPAGLPLSAGTGAVKAASDGTGAVTITSLTSRVCKVTGSGTVKLLEAGACDLSATQAADAGHNAPDAVRASFPVWSFPTLPTKARSTQVLGVLGKGEQSYRVVAGPAAVCRATDGDVALIDGGVCRVEIRRGGHVVRTDKVRVVVPAKPAATHDAMDIGATVYFAFDSARLTADGKATLRKVAPKLRKADLVVVYGHTYGPGKNSPASRALAAKRARVSVAFLDGLGVKSKVVSEVAMAMRQPVSATAWKNRRAEVYYR
jgi:outer membrane protein OmpA-like peptidoglycan-associated protein